MWCVNGWGSTPPTILLDMWPGIEVEDGVRLERALQRERTQKEPRYEEMCRRFLADSMDFSEEKLREAQITTRFENENLEETEQNIKKYMLQ